MWSQAQVMRSPVPRAAWLVLFAGAATATAWVLFTRLPPIPVRVGTATLGGSVPLGYQLSVFPAFGAFLGALVLDGLRGEARRTWLFRALLVASIGLLAIARLAGVLPLSGHACFLFAVLGYEIAPPSDRDSTAALALVVPALLVVAWCKLVVWGDPLWFCASAVLGGAVGAVLARAARA
jgi:hypothetical protein